MGSIFPRNLKSMSNNLSKFAQLIAQGKAQKQRQEEQEKQKLVEEVTPLL